ncbi:MAG: PaaI family thioesterase [Bifidobacteriaceae bacterium]|jgi:uncharacterized protein (TIGR00369 family)|nr:PaaI family thioesterase [Bifidobacteriaceae bacterium]
MTTGQGASGAEPCPPGPAGTLMERLGITVQEVTPATARGSMPVAGNTQPHGMLHGGASAALVETLGSLAASAHAGPDRRAVGIELGVTHHRSASQGLVHAVAAAAHLGRSLASYQVTVRDDGGQLIASGRLTCMLL